MLSIKKTKKNIPDLTQFTGEDGHKWIQTSANDLLSSDELNDILNKIENDNEKDDIVLARFDFRKVNKEYYETVVDLQARLKKQNEILKQLITDAKDTIDRKNNKLKELVKYIRKLHLLLAYYKARPGDADKLIPSPVAAFYESSEDVTKSISTDAAGELPEEAAALIEYADVEEILLDNEGNEQGPLSKKVII